MKQYITNANRTPDHTTPEKRIEMKKTMRKPTTGIAKTLAALVAAASPASASLGSSVSAPVKDLLCAIWDALVYVGVGAAGLIFVVAGVNYIAHRDNPAQRKSSISWIIHAVVGLIILMIAKTIVEGTKVPVACS